MKQTNERMNGALDISTFGGRQLAMLGRLFISKYPDLATEHIPRHAEPSEKDFTKIPSYYDSFPRTIEARRIFICCMVHLYSPGSFTDHAFLKRGLVKELSQVTGQAGGHTSVMIRQVIQWYKGYDDFKENVDNYLNEIR